MSKMLRKKFESYMWFEFGTSHDGNFVDISDEYNDTVLSMVPRQLAQDIIHAHNAAIENLLAYTTEK